MVFFYFLVMVIFFERKIYKFCKSILKRYLKCLKIWNIYMYERFKKNSDFCLVKLFLLYG